MTAIGKLWRRRAARGRQPAPFIVASPRSGTTLLRMMLDAHPQLAIPSETHFAPELIEACGRRGASVDEIVELITMHRRWPDFHLDEAELRRRLETTSDGGSRIGAGDALRAFFGLYADRHGKPRWGDKTPEYVLSMLEIQRALPEARFIHVIRDGRDVALSRVRWRMRRSGTKPPIDRLAKRWKKWIGRARRQARNLDHYLEVRYEDLILETEPTLREICEFAGLRWDPAVLDYHERASERLAEIKHELPATDDGKRELAGSERLHKHETTTKPPQSDRVAAWRESMSDEDRSQFERVAGDLLRDLGYPVGSEA